MKNRVLTILIFSVFLSCNLAAESGTGIAESQREKNDVFITSGVYPLKFQVGYGRDISEKIEVTASLSRQLGLLSYDIFGLSLGMIYRDEQNIQYGIDLGYAHSTNSTGTGGLYGELFGGYKINILGSLYFFPKFKVGTVLLSGKTPTQIIGIDLGFGYTF
ncbi:MAG: hypothetical protein SCALA702_00500 [Melioribacteraceae bacterium]|nr:MAG: hypothetical protein SCALA702_00500 [Melioribacteraceae bacterium]